MTNKDYKRLTNDLGFSCQLPIRVYDRLYELENAIENGTLVFLPCKVDDKFWWILNKCSGEHEFVQEKVKQIRICDYGFCIIDYDGTGWYLNEIYFTKEAAQKALEELEK
jgi:hypothetical protein